MAIQKSKTLPNGAVGNYWRITDIVIDRQNLKAVSHIALFKDQATSDSGAPPLGAVKTYGFAFTKSELLAITNVVSYVYGKIMTQATATVTHDLSGHAISPVAFDPDLAGGTMV